MGEESTLLETVFSGERMSYLYRTMRSVVVDGNTLPQLDRAARALGVRPLRAEVLEIGYDILIDEQQFVHPGNGGLSVNPDLLDRNIPRLLEEVRLSRARLPVELGGLSRDPLWRIALNDLPESLTYRPDEDNAEAHGVIEPARNMPLDEYEQAIQSTRCAWARVVV